MSDTGPARFSTAWERDDYEREKRGQEPLGPFGSGRLYKAYHYSEGREIGIESPDQEALEWAAVALVAHADMLAALRNVNELVSEAAMTGFNCHDGDWAERLFASQQTTHAAIAKGSRTIKPTDGD